MFIRYRLPCTVTQLKTMLPLLANMRNSASNTKSNNMFIRILWRMLVMYHIPDNESMQIVSFSNITHFYGFFKEQSEFTVLKGYFGRSPFFYLVLLLGAPLFAALAFQRTEAVFIVLIISVLTLVSDMVTAKRIASHPSGEQKKVLDFIENTLSGIRIDGKS